MTIHRIDYKFFFCSAATFAYLSFLAPTLSTLLSGTYLHLILTPAWVFFAFGSLLGKRVGKRFSSEQLMLFVALSIVFTFVALRGMQIFLVQGVVGAPDAKEAMVEAYRSMLLPISLITGLPFFFYGNLMTARLASSEIRVSQTLAIELMAMLFGMLACLLILNLSGSWRWTAFSIAVMGMVLPFFRQRKQALGLLILSLSVFFCEPKTHFNLSARNYDFKAKVTEVFASWTSYAKVQSLRVVNNDGRERRIISIGEGVGHAGLRAYRPDQPPENLMETAALANWGNPQNVLILFAGAGAEMVQIEQLSPRQRRIVGVEINPQVIGHALLEKDFNMDSFLQLPNISFVISDARRFLDRNQEKFDSILFSWAGATVAHYAGTIIHTTQYSLTTEAIERAWESLRPNGRLILVPGSKLSQIAALKRMSGEKDMLVFAERQDLDWKLGWDNHILVIKKGTFSEGEREELIRLMQPHDFQMVVSRDFFAEDFAWHSKLMNSSDVKSVLGQVQNETGLDFTPHPDDRPFVYSVFPKQDLFSMHLWKHVFINLSWTRIFSESHSLFLFVLLSVGVFLVFTLFRSPTLAPASIVGLLLGFAPAVLQVLVFYKLLLILGNPVVTIIVGSMAFLLAQITSLFVVRRLPIWFCLLAFALAPFSYLGATYLAFVPYLLVTFLSVVFGSLIYLKLMTELKRDGAVCLFTYDTLATALGFLAAPIFIEQYGQLEAIQVLAQLGVMGGLILVLFHFFRSRTLI